MADFDNNMRGVLFKNDKGDNDKRPDYTGTCEIDGVQMKMAAWVKESNRDGKKFFSISFTKEEKQESTSTESTQTPNDSQTNTGTDDDLPF